MSKYSDTPGGWAKLIAEAPMLAEQNAKMLAMLKRVKSEADFTLLAVTANGLSALIKEIEGE